MPTRHAWAVQTLLDAGATLIGKTITDEVSLGILGENPFDGTPLNPRAPDRVPGGSSSGSASAVAQGLCDTALGTDTGGSVRVPASFCGLYGIRPTHGRLDLTGMMPQAPSSDTTGWFARDAETFARVSAVMLGEPIAGRLPTTARRRGRRLRLRRRRDAAALQPMVGALAALVGYEPRGADGAARAVGLGAGAAHAAAVRGLADLQGLDRRATTRAWRSAWRARPGGGPLIPPSRAAWAALMRAEARARLALAAAAGHDPVPADDAVPGAAGASRCPALEPLRERITCLLRAGGLTGVPQVSLPGATVDGLPVGLSIVGARGSDAVLVAVAKAMEADDDRRDPEHPRGGGRGPRDSSSATSRR